MLDWQIRGFFLMSAKTGNAATVPGPVLPSLSSCPYIIQVPISSQ